MPKSLYYTDLALFEILLASLSAETGAKTMQIYTDWIDDWINCRINNLENVFICFQSPVNIIQTKVSKPRIKLCEYLLNFWNYDNSEFIKRYLAHGNNMTKKHTQNMIRLVKNYWQPYFGDDVFVDELDKPTLDDFFFFLYF